jgi:hypothetical protein
LLPRQTASSRCDRHRRSETRRGKAVASLATASCAPRQPLSRDWRSASAAGTIQSGSPPLASGRPRLSTASQSPALRTVDPESEPAWKLAWKAWRRQRRPRHGEDTARSEFRTRIAPARGVAGLGGRLLRRVGGQASGRLSDSLMWPYLFFKAAKPDRQRVRNLHCDLCPNRAVLPSSPNIPVPVNTASTN